MHFGKCLCYCHKCISNPFFHRQLQIVICGAFLFICPSHSDDATNLMDYVISAKSSACLINAFIFILVFLCFVFFFIFAYTPQTMFPVSQPTARDSIGAFPPMFLEQELRWWWRVQINQKGLIIPPPHLPRK